MKLYIAQLLTLAFFAVLAMPHTATAQQSPAQLLIGAWQFDDNSSFATMDEQTMAQLDTIPQLKTEILSSYSGRQLSITSDGKYTLSFANGQSTECSWSLSGNTLILVDQQNNVYQEEIKILTDQKLVLVPKIEGEMRNIIGEQHFIKY